MKHNEQNAIVKDVLTEEEIKQIYDIVEHPRQKSIMKLFAQTVSDFDLPMSVAQKVIEYSQAISGESDLEISEYQFARYTNVVDPDSGEPLLPNLTPHWDSTFQEPRFTFDYQIGGNTTWPLVVEEKEFTLENNSALTFSGTHQIHWRTPKSFSENEYIDMIFFHLRKRNANSYSEDLPNKMYEKENFYQLKYQEGLK